MRFIATFVLLAICAISPHLALCQVDSYWNRQTLRHIDVSDGLPHNAIEDIATDANGMIWIATNGGGLCRYDGHDFLYLDENAQPALSCNFVHAVAADANGRVWIGTENGLELFDSNRGSLVPLNLADERTRAATAEAIGDIVVDKAGNVWLRSTHRIACLTQQADGSLMVEDEICSAKRFKTMSGNADGIVAILGHDVMRARMTKGHIVTATVHLGRLDRLDDAIDVLEADSMLWVATRNGLVRQNMRTGFEDLLRRSSDETTISQSCATALARGPQGEVFVGTLRGVNVCTDAQAVIPRFERLTQEPNSHGLHITQNFIHCLLATADALWIGTDVAGCDLMTPVSAEATHFTSLELGSVRAADEPSSRPVNSIMEDADGTLWVGNVEGGLSRRRAGEHTFTNFDMRATGLTHNSISALAADRHGLLWVGTWGGWLNKVDVSGETPRALPLTLDGSLGSSFIGALAADSINDGIWVASTTMVSFINSDGHVSHPLPHKITDNMNGALGAAIDAQGQLWLGIQTGLVIIDLHTLRGDSVAFHFYDNRLDYISQDGAPVQGIRNEKPRITFIHHTRDGKTYVGTDGYGLYMVREDDDTFYFARVNKNDGLRSNTVDGIGEDAYGNIWVSTPRGLCVRRPLSDTWANLTTEDGMLSDCYYWNAAYSSRRTGTVLFGSLAGLTEIEHLNTSMTDTTTPPPPMFTRLSVSNETILPDGETLKTPIWDAQEVRIHESARSFAIDFSALNFVAPQNVKYEYRLDGFDLQWLNSPAGQHSAQYTNLQPGDYTLRVRYYTPDGRQSAEKATKIVIKPYFFKTPAFVMFTLLAIAAVCYIYVRRRWMRIVRTRQELRDQVELRTAELMEQKDLLEEKKAELEEQKNLLEKQKDELQDKNEELKRQNEYITAQREEMAAMTEKIQRLSVDKMQFFTNVSHELRSPLTLIGGPIRKALEITDKEDVRDLLKMASRNAQNLLETVNQLMDFRKVDTSNLKLHPISTEIVPFVKETAAPYVAYAAERGMTLNVLIHITTQYAKLDSDAMHKVLTNLLSNAIKYSPSGSRITLSACQLMRDGHPTLYLSVRDNGPGVPDDFIDKMFDMFYQIGQRSPSHEASSGIGLYVVRQIVNQSGGEVYARNNPGGGLSMRILLPLEACDAPMEPQSATATQTTTPAYDAAHKSAETNILVVDDSRDMRAYIRTILENDKGEDGYNFRVFEAENGLTALSAMAENDIDFVVTDLMMPVMDGLEMARRVKTDMGLSHIPILILTAQMGDEYQTEGYRVGVESYLRKPFDEKMLRARIAGILSKRESAQRKFAITMDTADLNIEHESADEKFVRRVTDFVKEHFRDPEFSITDITDDLGCSKSMLHKKMQSVMGQSPGNFVRMYRLNVARELLKERERNDMNVSQVAYEVGFNDPKYFSRCFAKEFGYPPSQIG